ncbi:unnamed protein product [Prorocentrum cordatum]|uniref:Uncharacterized protein n=1 Tax=Prorocentrum cordatum TaxID=2364126 RepID=A0ABN9YIK9_9DINO|nr:unnamed protein product [Polarella glacialis]CAK0910994.1 unnamed protein product [Polarella glacialis]
MHLVSRLRSSVAILARGKVGCASTLYRTTSVAVHFGHMSAPLQRRDYPTGQPDVPQLPGSLKSPIKAACDFDDESSDNPKRVSEAACSAQGPSRTCAPGTPRASQTVCTTPPSTPRVRSRVPTTPPPLQIRERAEPLLLALERNCLKQVRLAIEADPEAAKEPFWDCRFEWPLCAAVRLGCSAEVVRLLMENGAKVDVTSVGGQSPLQLLGSGTGNHSFSARLIDLRGVPNTPLGTAEWTAGMRQSTAQFELGVATALLNAGADPAADHRA